MKIKKIVRHNQSVKVYDLEIQDEHTYIVSGVIVHNCVACGSLDGTIYKKIEDVPVYVRHSRCRCQILPITPEIKDAVPETYSEWFEKQSDKDKYKILGKTRFQLYENGMKIKQFVNNGKLTPLKDLNK